MKPQALLFSLFFLFAFSSSLSLSLSLSHTFPFFSFSFSVVVFLYFYLVSLFLPLQNIQVAINATQATKNPNYSNICTPTSQNISKTERVGANKPPDRLLSHSEILEFLAFRLE